MLCEQGIVEKIIEESSSLQVVEVLLQHGERVTAIYYFEPLVNDAPFDQGLMIKDVVLINKSALTLGLGTGGYAFVVSKLGHFIKEKKTYPGHIMKLRYTPYQQPVLASEAPESLFHHLYLDEEFDLKQKPVFLGELHSMLPLLLYSLQRLNRGKTFAYIMDDQACMDLRFSQHVRQLKEEVNLKTITFGQAMGGDYESVNLYTALETAEKVAQADFILIMHGPGVTGTATSRGFSGMQLAHWVHVITSCGGLPICIPRVHTQFKRERHFGISHHTLTPLVQHTFAPCTLPYFDLSNVQSLTQNLEQGFIKRYNEQIDTLRIKHKLIAIDFEQAKVLCEQALEHYPYKLSSMGNTYVDEPLFFIHVSAAALVLEEIQKKRSLKSEKGPY